MIAAPLPLERRRLAGRRFSGLLFLVKPITLGAADQQHQPGEHLGDRLPGVTSHFARDILGVLADPHVHQFEVVGLLAAHRDLGIGYRRRLVTHGLIPPNLPHNRNNGFPGIKDTAPMRLWVDRCGNYLFFPSFHKIGNNPPDLGVRFAPADREEEPLRSNPVPIPPALQVEADAFQERRHRLLRTRARLDVLSAHNSQRGRDLNASMRRASIHTIPVDGAVLQSRNPASGLHIIDLGPPAAPPPARAGRGPSGGGPS